MKILICNVGSSSFKFSLFGAEDEQLLAEGEIDWSAQPTGLVYRCRGQQEVRRELRLQQHLDALSHILEVLQAGSSPPLGSLSDIQAVGHRVVHGGDRYSTAVRITPDVKQVIGELGELAPLHNPPALEGIHAAEQILAGVPQVAAFDTAFHSTLSETARTYPLPRMWTRQWGIRRYGFHGLSHSYCAIRAAELLNRSELRIVIAHLGNGASVSAVRDGVCVDTSMGFTPLDGLMMGTRCGSVDPGILLYLLQHKGLDASQLDKALNHESGLLGVSGFSSDMRQVLSELPHNPDARLAVDLFVHRIRQTVGGMVATLGGIDALVFTAGVGEHAPEIRRQVCENMDFLGLKIDRHANENCQPDADISMSSSAARILVISTREDLTIVRQTLQVLSAPKSQPPGAECAQLPQRSEI
jgi:acetate kinase